MDEEQAAALAEIVGGETWQSGGGIWLVRKRRTDGKYVVFSDEVISLYPNEESVETGEPEQSLVFV